MTIGQRSTDSLAAWQFGHLTIREKAGRVFSALFNICTVFRMILNYWGFLGLRKTGSQMKTMAILYSVMFISELAHGQGAYGRVLIPTDENTKTIVHGVHN